MKTKQVSTICLTEDIKDWSEPKDKLEAIKARLEKYIGKQVIVWGGGGYGGAWVTLDKVELHPTIIRDKDGYTLKAYLSNCPKELSGYLEDDKFDPWLGSWQLNGVPE